MFAERFREKILNIGHRGAPVVAPENTISSFQKAVELGADGVELDVSLSRDGAIMVFHDYFLQKKTNGKGLLSAKKRNELQKLDVTVPFSGKYETAQLPTLQEVVESLDDSVFIMIEIKTNFLGKPGIEEAVVALIKKYNLYDRTVVSSFSPLSLKRVKDIDPSVNVGFLHMPLVQCKHYLTPVISSIRPDVLHPYHKRVNDSYVKFAREKGCRVFTWTLKSEYEMKRVIEIGVNGIITDYPDLLKSVNS